MDNEKHFKTELDKEKAKRVPVIQVSFAYDIFTSPNDDSEPKLSYTNAVVEGYIDDKGNIEFPKNEVIWEKIDKALIVRHRLKKLNLLKSSYRILCSDGHMGQIGRAHV